MKKILFFLIIVFTSMFFVGCYDKPESPAVAYYIGAEYHFENISGTFKMELDKENERFIFYYNLPDTDTEKNTTGFVFHTKGKNYVGNSEEFTITDKNGERVVFNERYSYEFYGANIFYISYKNANEEIKTAVNERLCSIGFCDMRFVFFQYDDDDE